VTSRGTPEPASLSGYVIGQYGRTETVGRGVICVVGEDVDPASAKVAVQLLPIARPAPEFARAAMLPA